MPKILTAVLFSLILLTTGVVRPFYQGMHQLSDVLHEMLKWYMNIR